MVLPAVFTDDHFQPSKYDKLWVKVLLQLLGLKKAIDILCMGKMSKYIYIIV
jgi:hypothetical protein